MLDTPEDLPVLGTPTEREFYYRLLQSPLGGTLRQIGRNRTRFAQIRAAAEWIGTNADQPMRVDELAASVGMSVTSFHRHFKAVTAHSPLAYQRHIRLLEARRRLASGTIGVTQTAFAVGYASPAQFSREYKRVFGVPPIRDAAALRDLADRVGAAVSHTAAPSWGEAGQNFTDAGAGRPSDEDHSPLLPAGRGGRCPSIASLPRYAALDVRDARRTVAGDSPAQRLNAFPNAATEL